MIVVDLNAYKYSDVTEREAFALQLRGAHALVHKSAHYSLKYALDVLDKPFPAGEDVIAGDTRYSYWYARQVLKNPFPAGEAAISGDAEYSYYYAVDVLKTRFPAGEAVIATDAGHSYLYAKRFSLRLVDGDFQPC